MRSNSVYPYRNITESRGRYCFDVILDRGWAREVSEMGICPSEVGVRELCGYALTLNARRVASGCGLGRRRRGGLARSQ